jgi:hypothetical protein
LCPTAWDKGNKREKGGVRVAWLGLGSLVGFAKEEEKRKEKDLMNLAKIHLNFEKF